jgi:hypothetical protein
MNTPEDLKETGSDRNTKPDNTSSHGDTANTAIEAETGEGPTGQPVPADTVEEVPAGVEEETPGNWIFSVIGGWLIAAFFFPLLVTGSGSPKLDFLSIDLLLNKDAPEILKFQVVYPLIAGVLMLILARMFRSVIKSIAITAIGLLPFLLVLVNDVAQDAFLELVQHVPKGFSLGAPLIPIHIAVIAMLAGAHACRVNPIRKIATYVAMSGALIYIILLVAPLEGRFPFLAPFKSLSAGSRAGAGIDYHTGMGALIAMLLMIYAASRCFLLLNRSYDRKIVGNSIWRLWYVHLFVYTGFFIYVFLLTQYTAGVMSLWSVVALITGIVKFLPWIVCLYLLIPLGIAESILLGTPVHVPVDSEIDDFGEYSDHERTPWTVEQRLESLKLLRQKDLITDEEYERKKAEILEDL